MFNRKKNKEKLEEFQESTPEEQVKELKKLTRLTYKTFFWISIFLLAPTIGSHFLPWNIIPIARDIGIFLLFVGLWKINKGMEKKKKEEEQ